MNWLTGQSSLAIVGIRWIASASLAVGVNVTSSVSAQQIAHSFQDLPMAVKTGANVRILYGTSASGGTAEGTLTQLADRSVTILAKSGQVASFTADDVRRIERRTALVPLRAGIGAAVGGFGLWVYAIRTRDCGACDSPSGQALAFGSLMGAAIGLPFDLRAMWRPIYRGPGHSPTWTISPNSSARGWRVLAGIKF